MKDGKRPTRKQAILLKNNRLNPDNWLIYKNLSDQLHIIHRFTGTKRVVPLP